MLDHLLVGVVAFGVVVVLTPAVRWVSCRTGAGVDRPEPRKVHSRPVPRLGGLALFAAVVGAIGVGSLLPAFDEVFAETSEPEAILLAASTLLLLGLLDDTRGVSAPAKLAGQVVAAGILVLFGFRLMFVYIPGSPGTIISLSPDLGALLTIFAVVAMINAVNLTDGLDGLAAGIVAIAGLALFAYVQLAEPFALALASSAGLVLAAVVGACLGFLVYNFNPASIFMGDTGAMLLGLLLAASGVSAIQGTVQPTRGTFAALSVPVLVPMLVLGVPFFDTIWAIVRRIGRGGPVFAPDKQHLHHRLIEIGHSHRRAVLIMYYWSALVAFAAVGVGLFDIAAVAAVLGAGVLLAVVVVIGGRLHRWHKRSESPQHFVFSFTKFRRGDQKTASDQRKRGSAGL